jgi:hypothetical protein
VILTVLRHEHIQQRSLLPTQRQWHTSNHLIQR